MGLLDNSEIVHKSRPPLRWVANFFGWIGGWVILKICFLDEDENFGLRYKFYSFIYDLFMPIYFKYGSFYEFNFDMSGKGWDDYDENGVPYWEQWHWDFIDEETGDAFKVINYEKEEE